VGIACDPKERIVEICAKGGKKVRDEYAQAFAKHFAPHSKTPVEAPRREVLLDKLRSDPVFLIEPADGIGRVEVSSLDFFSKEGGFSRHERRDVKETIYQFLERAYGPFAPSKAGGWTLVAATLRIFFAATEDKRRRTLTVTLRAPNTTTIPNKTETDREFVLSLLERWGLIAPPPSDLDVIEAA